MSCLMHCLRVHMTMSYLLCHLFIIHTCTATKVSGHSNAVHLRLSDLGLDLMCIHACNSTCQLWRKVALRVAKPRERRLLRNNY